MEVPAPIAGVVKEILIKWLVIKSFNWQTHHENLKLHHLLQVAAAAPAQTAAPVAATTSAIKDVNVPDIGGDEVNVTEIMVAVW